ncbi:MAG: response regulator [Candidatus Omnitrophica bacterium]|nr:response regulator [Candidatus Omnitrophota bacterium]MDD5488489.1 response regulator [Candidatus Omnitrophota bacterium]
MARKILIIDDDADFVGTLSKRLLANKYDVTVAFDAVQGLAKAHKEKPDLILLDISMPAGGGESFFRNIKQSVNTATIPVILLTAHNDSMLRAKFMQQGAHAFITKPYEPQELMSEIKKALGD